MNRYFAPMAKMDKRAWIVISVLTVAAAATVFVREMPKLWRANTLLAESLPVELVVNRVELAEGPGIGQHLVQVHTQAADGRLISGQRLQAIDRYSTLRSARAFADRFQVGQRVSGWYVPTAPHDAFLLRVVYFDLAVYPALAVGLAAFALWILLGMKSWRLGSVACSLSLLATVPVCFVPYLQLPGASWLLGGLGMLLAATTAVAALLPIYLARRWRQDPAVPADK